MPGNRAMVGAEPILHGGLIYDYCTIGRSMESRPRSSMLVLGWVGLRLS